jgi:amidophosphoribosyltransferase
MCGLIGIARSPDAAALAIEGLHTQQFRGLESAGVATGNGSGVHLRGGLGLVQDVFSQTVDVLGQLPGNLAIGHIRYSTVAKDPRNSRLYQPIRGKWGTEPFCLAHNGNLPDTSALLPYVEQGSLTSSVDSEIIVRFLESFNETGIFEDDFSNALRMLRGAFCLLLVFRDEIIAVRDPQGVHPLSIGRREDGTLVVASETCALETLEAPWLGDVEPGTFVRIRADGETSVTRFAEAAPKQCIFQLVYFGHPASIMYGTPIYEWRVKVGEAMERMFPTPGADIVVPVPDSAIAYGIGYGTSGRSGRYVPGIWRHHYTGRTFIQPTQDKREAAVRRKFQSSIHDLKGKSVVLIDDSIVRGTTSHWVVDRVWKAGAREVHMLSAYDAIRHSCLYGVDTPEKKKLVAATKSVEETCRFIGATSLRYFPIESLLAHASGPPGHWCTACTTGEYWHTRHKQEELAA